jgi:hypothetical protein
MLHGGDQYHDETQVNLSPEKAHGGGRVAATTTVLGTAKTQSPLIGLIQQRTDSTRFTWITSTVQNTPTRTPPCLDLGGNILINPQLKLSLDARLKYPRNRKHLPVIRETFFA